VKKQRISSAPDRFNSFGICELRNEDPDRNRRRYYCIDLQQGLFELILLRQWGRIGCRPREMRQYFESVDDAVVEANRLYRQKNRRGYRETNQEGFLRPS